MAMLAGQAGILTAFVAAAGMLALALLAFPEIRRRIGGLATGRKDVFAALPATRRGMLGIEGVGKGPSPAARNSADRSLANGRTALSDGGGELPLGADASRHLLAVAALCSRVDLDVQRILMQLAAALPSPFSKGEPWSCRIELMEAGYWSPGYANPSFELATPLRVGGKQVGSIRIGPVGEASPSYAEDESRAFLEAAAGLACQMLDRHADRFELQKLRSLLAERQLMIRQTARLAKIGAWEYDAQTGLFKWSDETRRIAGIDTDRAGRERERQIAKELLPFVEESIVAGKPLDHEFACLTPNGDAHCLHAIGDVESASGSARIVGIIRDVTDDRGALSRLRHIANHDVLTELPNRRYFQERIEGALRDRGAKGALLIIDIDRFKDLNDTSGHDVGDMLLRDFGRRLQEAAEGAFVARLGGDEFAVLMPIGDRIQAEHLARTLIAGLTGPIVVFGRSATVQVSAGLSMYPADGRSAPELLKSADLALYEAKARGRNCLVAYADELRRQSEDRARIRAEVRDTLPDKQFVPYYQPKIRLDTGEIAGFEALLRWDHPDGIRSPGSIVPALEDPELSRALCAALLDRIIADMARWQSKGVPFGRIAFNASSSEFSGFDLASHLTWRLKAIGLSPSNLGVEVTEAVFLDGAAESIAATLTQLRAAGIEIALDDFGTGFASLTHLQDFPVDVIKIDQSFIRRLVTDSDSRAITHAVLNLGRGLGKTVVAEGVETAEQALLLKVAGCDQVQGFYFARPMPGENLPKFVANWRGAEQINALKKDAA
ncbi:MAG: putative bifunctional diguanylate cyclase/phosphodiesterase [Propylenella sp.]